MTKRLRSKYQLHQSRNIYGTVCGIILFFLLIKFREYRLDLSSAMCVAKKVHAHCSLRHKNIYSDSIMKLVCCLIFIKRRYLFVLSTPPCISLQSLFVFNRLMTYNIYRVLKIGKNAAPAASVRCLTYRFLNVINLTEIFSRLSPYFLELTSFLL